MRTKNPFCTTIQLAVLRALNGLKLPVRHGYLNEMAKSLSLSSATVYHALAELENAGHVYRLDDERGTFWLSPTGDMLVNCADAMDAYRTQTVKKRR
jgi:DNA-binding GntR family transcriptional regulator